jgi:hypothetical protein
VKTTLAIVSLNVGFLISSHGFADEKDQAYRLHNRLTCEAPSRDVLDQMTDLIKKGDSEGAAKIAVQNRGFLECTVKQWCASQTNKDQRINVKLNDYCATVIGGVRDGKSFGDLLSADIIYFADPNKYKGTTPLPAYSPANNDHYVALENSGADLADILVERKQTEYAQIEKASGLLTTRAFGEAFLSLGTNRRAVRHSMLNYLCTDLEQMMDTTRPDTMVARDVERDPGSDSATYNNKCKGCHAGQDFFRGAWAFYDFDATSKRVVYTPGQVVKKYNINPYFPNGWITRDDTWANNWIEGQNAKFGWPQNLTTGKGVASFGEMLAKTEEFNTCMAKRAFKTICQKEGTDDNDKKIVAELASDFKSSNQNLKTLFIKTATRCQAGE